MDKRSINRLKFNLNDIFICLQHKKKRIAQMGAFYRYNSHILISKSMGGIAEMLFPFYFWELGLKCQACGM